VINSEVNRGGGGWRGLLRSQSDPPGLRFVFGPLGLVIGQVASWSRLGIRGVAPWLNVVFHASGPVINSSVRNSKGAWMATSTDAFHPPGPLSNQKGS